MSKSEMLQAKQLIIEKRYDEARAILSQIDHPTAKKWLQKLNEIAPAPPPEPAPQRQTKPQPQSTRRAQSVPQQPQRSFESSPGIGNRLTLMMGGVASLVGVVFVYFMASAVMNSANECQVAQWWDDTGGPVVVEFLDTTDVAESTSRISVSPLVLELQRIRRDFERIEYPDCTREAYNHLNTGMNATIQAFEYFVGGSENDNLTSLHLSQAEDSFALANAAFVELDFYDADRRLGIPQIDVDNADGGQVASLPTRYPTSPPRQLTLPPTWTPTPTSLPTISRPTLPPTWTPMPAGGQDAYVPPASDPVSMGTSGNGGAIAQMSDTDFEYYVAQNYDTIAGQWLDIDYVHVIEEVDFLAVGIVLTRESGLYTFADQSEASARSYAERLMADANAYFGNQEFIISVTYNYYTDDLEDYHYDDDWWYIGDYDIYDGWYVSKTLIRGFNINGRQRYNIWNYR